MSDNAYYIKSKLDTAEWERHRLDDYIDALFGAPVAEEVKNSLAEATAKALLKRQWDLKEEGALDSEEDREEIIMVQVELPAAQRKLNNVLFEYGKNLDGWYRLSSGLTTESIHKPEPKGIEEQVTYVCREFIEGQMPALGVSAKWINSHLSFATDQCEYDIDREFKAQELLMFVAWVSMGLMLVLPSVLLMQALGLTWTFLVGAFVLLCLFYLLCCAYLPNPLAPVYKVMTKGLLADKYPLLFTYRISISRRELARLMHGE